MSKAVETISRRAALKVALGTTAAFTAAAAASAEADPVSSLIEHHPDADLLRLDSLMAAAIAAEIAVRHDADDRVFDAAMDKVRAVVEQIIATPATTFAGVQVKARALWWSQGFEYCVLAADDQPTVDDRAVDSILRDLLGAPKRGEPA